MLITESEKFANELKKDFNLKYVKPSFETEKELSRIESLYVIHRGRHKFTGSRKQSLKAIDTVLKKNLKKIEIIYVLQVLNSLQEKSPESFENFTISLWDQLTISLFNMVLPKKTSLVLAHSKTGARTQHSLSDGCCPEQIIKILLDEHQKEVKQIQSDYNDLMNNFIQHTLELRPNEEDIIWIGTNA